MDLVKAFSAAPKEAVFPKREYEDRLKQVRTVMLERGLDLLLMHNMPNICWLCGHQTPMADWYNCLIIPAQGELTLQICDVALGIVNSHTVTKFEFVRWYATLSDAAPQLIDLLGNYSIHGRRVGLEMRRPGLDPATFCELTRSFPRTEFVDATDVVLNLRAVKSPAEIERLRRAANMTDVAMHAAMAAIKPGATENTVAATAVDAMFRAGSEFLSIAPLIRAGARGAMAHGMFNNNPINPGDSVVIEFGAVSGRYTAPIFRTAVIGKAPDRLQRLVDQSLQALEILYANVRANRTMHEVTAPVVQYLKTVDPDADTVTNHAYAVGIGFPPDWVEHSVFMRPGSQEVLKAGMTFHTPRSFRVPNVMCAGFSETIVVTEHGCEALTSHPRRLYVA